MGKRPRPKPQQSQATALAWYDERLPLHERLAAKVRGILEEVLRVTGVQVHRVEARVKTKKSFQGKADKKVGRRAKYKHPTKEITDLVGVRVITYLDSTVKQVCGLVEKEFEVDDANSIDKDEALGVDRVGYRSRHYVAKLGRHRSTLPECVEFEGVRFEIQVRSLLQHAWAEMEHDRRFKYPGHLPPDLKRRYALLAGLLETADREFNALAREIDVQAAQTARAATTDETGAPLTVANVASYLRGVLAQYLPSGRVEPGLGGDGAAELVTELQRFGVGTLRDLASLLPSDFTHRFPETIRHQTTFIGLLRDAMLLQDARRYFSKAWQKGAWSTMSQSEVEMLKKRGVEIEPLLNKHGITLPEDELIDETGSSAEYDGPIEWVDGPRAAVKSAIENLEWDFDDKVVRTADGHDDHQHQGAVEFTTREQLVEYLDEVGFEPYNNSAPRSDGEWVFPYDDSIAEDLLSEMCSEEMERMGWE